MPKTMGERYRPRPKAVSGGQGENGSWEAPVSRFSRERDGSCGVTHKHLRV
jgi:hypothetical protein